VDVVVKGGPTLIPGLAFPKDSSYLPVAAGSYDLQVRAANTEVVALDLPGVTLESGKIYDVFAVGEFAKGTLKVQVASPAPQGDVMPTAVGMPATGTPALPWLVLALAGAALTVAGGGLVLRRQTR
jgi:hypothetical protein